jgi:hypothetical protein
MQIVQILRIIENAYFLQLTLCANGEFSGAFTPDFENAAKSKEAF